MALDRFHILMDSDAKSAAELAVELATTTCNQEISARAYILAARAFFTINKKGQAKLCLARAATVAEEAGLDGIKAVVMMESSLHLFSVEEPTDSMALLATAEQIFSDLGDYSGVGRVLVMRGIFEFHQDKPDEAEASLNSGLCLIESGFAEEESSTSWTHLCSGYQTLGLLHLKRGRLPLADRYLGLALAVADERALNCCAQLAWTKAEVAERLGFLDAALAYYLQAQAVLTDHPMDRAWLHIDVSRVRCKLGDAETAAAELAAAAELLKEEAPKHEPATRALGHLSLDPDELWLAREALLKP